MVEFTHNKDIPQDRLKTHFTNLNLPLDAQEYLLGIWHASQFFDDLLDGDPVTRDDVMNTIYYCFSRQNLNPFYLRYISQLVPMQETIIVKWIGSDKAERAKNADARSFVWRASYYDLVVFVTCLCHGMEAATNASDYLLNMYGESLDEYLKEFK